MNHPPSVTTRQALEIKETQWKQQWIDTFLQSGVTKKEAEEAFYVCYSNQKIDVLKDPVDDARGISGMTKI
jgi:hypothetical protein